MSPADDSETSDFVRLALNCEALWTNHHARADGTKPVAQRRVDRFREAVEAGDPDAINGLSKAVLGSAVKMPPWMAGYERDSEQRRSVRRDVPHVDRSAYELVDYVISSHGNHLLDRAFPRTRPSHRDPDAIRRVVSYMRAVLHSNAQFWLRERGIKVRLRDNDSDDAR